MTTAPFTNPDSIEASRALAEQQALEQREAQAKRKRRNFIIATISVLIAIAIIVAVAILLWHYMPWIEETANAVNNTVDTANTINSTVN